MQLFYISNRPKILNGTLELVDMCMPFIHEVLVVMPKENIPEQSNNYSFNLKYIPEDQLLDTSQTKDLDHSSLNYLIRTQVIREYEGLDDEFIMSDDDFRPLVQMTASEFKSDNKYRSYYFYELNAWKHVTTDFDICLLNSKNNLSQSEMPTLAYASHMPQIINKEIFIESADFFRQAAKEMSLCEWTTYFNYAQAKYPDLFHEAEPYANICWPDYPNIWPEYVTPQKAKFENFYEHLYNKGDLFGGIDEIPTLGNLEYNRKLKLDKIVSFKEKYHFPYLTYRAKYLSIAMRLMNRTSPMIRKKTLNLVSAFVNTKRQIFHQMNSLF